MPDPLVRFIRVEKKGFGLKGKVCYTQTKSPEASPSPNKERGTMANLMTGAPVAQAISDRIRTDVERLNQQNIVPTLAIVRVGEDPADLSYEKGLTKKAEALGVRIEKTVLPVDVEQEALMAVIERINQNDSIHGCLLFRPLPKHLDGRAVMSALKPEKDVDAMTSGSMGGLVTKEETGFPPCTAEACLEMLDFYHIPLEGKNVVVMGRGMAVGMPTALLAIHRSATVTVCHSKSDRQRVLDLCRQADIIVAAVGRAGMIGAEHVSPGQTILDVGINVNAEGKLCGDVDFEAVEPIVANITPVPRGVGAVTSTLLMEHVVRAALRSAGL